MGDYCGSPYTYSSADSSYNNASAEEYVLHPVEEVLVEEPKITKDGRIARRPGKQAATPDSELTEAELQKRINRRKRNKDAAMRSRQKKLQKTENLEVQVKNLKQSLNNCKAENEELKSELSRLQAQWDAHGRSCVSYAEKRKAENYENCEGEEAKGGSATDDLAEYDREQGRGHPVRPHTDHSHGRRLHELHRHAHHPHHPRQQQLLLHLRRPPSGNEVQGSSD